MINSWTIGNRLPFFIEIKMKLRAILEGRWYTGRNAHQIWAEWAVWARWQILNGSQFFFHFNEKWLSVDNISWIHYQICLDKNLLPIHLRDCCGKCRFCLKVGNLPKSYFWIFSHTESPKILDLVQIFATFCTFWAFLYPK